MNSKWIVAFSLALSLALTPTVVAQEPTPQAQRKAALTDLGSVFRAVGGGAIMPVGPIYKEFYAAAELVSTEPPTCRMQVLRLDDPSRSGYDVNAPRQLSLFTVLRFLLNEKGAPLAGDLAALRKRCQQEPVGLDWFSGGENPRESIFAAWTASEALRAIAAGHKSYNTIDLTQYFDEKYLKQDLMGRPISIVIYAQTGARSVSSVFRRASGKLGTGFWHRYL